LSSPAIFALTLSTDNLENRRIKTEWLCVSASLMASDAPCLYPFLKSLLNVARVPVTVLSSTISPSITVSAQRRPAWPSVFFSGRKKATLPRSVKILACEISFAHLFGSRCSSIRRLFATQMLASFFVHSSCGNKTAANASDFSIFRRLNSDVPKTMHDYHSIIQAEKKADVGGGNNGKLPGIETCRMIKVVTGTAPVSRSEAVPVTLASP